MTSIRAGGDGEMRGNGEGDCGWACELDHGSVPVVILPEPRPSLHVQVSKTSKGSVLILDVLDTPSPRSRQYA
ncbi:hypothetical protein WAI453_008302 [Rhynchosporium graminicola]